MAFVKSLTTKYPIPAEWAKGPLKDNRRVVTDKCCLMLFILYLIGMIITAIYGFSNSSSGAFTKMYDSSRNVCGQGAAADYPILYMQTFSKPYKSVCVKSCPVFDYNAIKGVSDPLNFNQFTSQFAGNSYTYNNILTEKEAFEYPKYWANNYFTEAQWNNYLNNFKLDCLPNNQFSNCKNSANFAIYDSYTAVRSVCTPLSPKAALLFNKVSSKFNLGDLEDMYVALPLFGWTALIALGISFVFLVIVSLCSGFIVWILLALVILAFAGFSAVIFQGLYSPGELNNPFNPLRVKYLQFWLDYQPLLLALAIVSIIAALFFIYFICRYAKYVGTSSHLIGLAAKQTLREIVLIILSIVILLIQIGVFFLEIWIILRIYTTGTEIHDTATGSPFILYSNNAWVYIMVIQHVFGMYWIMVTLNNLNDFVTSGVVVDYYFTSIIQPLHVLCHSLGYHLGSIAWSIIILPITIIKYTFGIFDFCLTSNNPNAIQRGLRKACSCCCWAWENFIDVFSERYFPIVYIGSIDFCPATRTYYALAETFADQIHVLLVVGEIISIAGRIIVTSLATYCGYLIYKGSIYYQQNIDNLWLLWIFLALISFFVGSLFVNLFAQTYDTTYVCYLIELALKENGLSVTGGPKELQAAVAEFHSKAHQTGNYKPLA